MLVKRRSRDHMSECKHGLKAGCSYCHVSATTMVSKRPGEKKRSPASRMSEKMNDRMTALKRRLREIRGEMPETTERP
jgi:hypothetical protein